MLSATLAAPAQNASPIGRLSCVDPLNNSAFSPIGREKKPWSLA
jgi:hypothetical protein